MDAYSGKREINRTMAPKKGCNMASKSLVRERDQNSEFCNRIGCSGRIKYSQNKRAIDLDVSKCSSTSVQSSVGNKIPGNSSSSSVITTSKNTYVEGKRKLPSSRPRCDSSESSVSSDSEASELVSTPRSSTSSAYHSKSKKRSGSIISSESASSSGSSNVNSSKGFDHISTPNNRSSSLNSSVSGKRTSPGSVNGSNGNQYGLRNLKCSSSVKNITPPSCSSSDTNTTGKNVMRKRSQEGERNGLPRRGERKTSVASSSSSSVVNGHVSSFSSGISISGSAQSSSDRNRAGPVWTRRSTVNVNPRTGFSRNNGPPVRGTLINDVPGISDNLISFRIGGRSSSRPLTSHVPSTAPRSRALSSANVDDPLTGMPFASSSEAGFTHLIGQNSLRRYNMNDIAEVLFALDMIEHDEELTREQVRVLETSLLLSGLNLYDQHRDMRLDIDNMSYEELLALEERMGTVSTALSEEEISKCLVKGIYEQTVQVNGDDAKCSICQEEYEVGDETGTLVECKHRYHMTCVTQWLKIKNWCPVCKGSAVSSSS